LFIRGSFTTGTVTASEAQLGLPTGCTIGGKATGLVVVGKGNRDASTAGDDLSVLATAGDTFLNFMVYLDSNSAEDLTEQGGSSVASNSMRITFTAGPIPIAEWAGASFVGTNNVEYASVGGTWDAASSTTVFGQSGSLMGGALTNNREKTITWQTPIQPGDRIQVWGSEDQVNWFPINGARLGGTNTVIAAHNNSGTLIAGVSWYKGSTANQTIVRFGRYMSISPDESPLNEWPSSSAYWVATKSSAGTPVGFGLAAGGQSGLLPYYNTTTVALDNNFTGGVLSITRIGNVVTITSDIAPTHSSLSTVQSNTGLIPSWAVPSANIQNTNSYDSTSGHTVFVLTNGQIRLLYKSETADVSLTAANSPINITYVKTDA
jgi:hypothetical protein